MSAYQTKPKSQWKLQCVCFSTINFVCCFSGMIPVYNNQTIILHKVNQWGDNVAVYCTYRHACDYV